jgi:hypothetical protein
MYENGKLRPVETVLKRGERKVKVNDRGWVNLTKIY